MEGRREVACRVSEFEEKPGSGAFTDAFTGARAGRIAARPLTLGAHEVDVEGPCT